MHGRWAIPVRLRVNRWSMIILVIILAASSNAMPPRASSIEFNRIREEDDEVRAQLEVVKERILADLGMSQVPDVSKANVSESHMNEMLELYKRSVVETEKEELEDDEDAVLRFYSYTDAASSEHTIFHIRNNSASKRVFFPLHNNSSLKQKGRYLQSAKLQIPIEKGWPNPHILIYRLLEESSSPNSSQVLVINQIVDITSPSVAQVDISDIVRLWLDNPKLNFGLLLECQGCWNVSDKSALHRESLILDVMVSELPARVKRSNQFLPDFIAGTTGLDCTKGFRTKKCCRRSLKVSFKEIDWNWIVQPTEFEAYYCKGKCNVGANVFASTHAIVQSLLNRKGQKVPRPCCAPRRLKALTLLHYNDKNPPQLTVSRQKGMIVKECACS